MSASDPTPWRADHHMHLASVDLCRLVGECLPSNHPPAVFASDAIRALDEANVSRGVILSCAYLYGLPSLHLSAHEITVRTRRENEFTAAEVAKYPTRLVGFLSVNPLQTSAIDEIRHWRGSSQLIGLKLHFTASAVHMRSAVHRRAVRTGSRRSCRGTYPRHHSSWGRQVQRIRRRTVHPGRTAQRRRILGADCACWRRLASPGPQPRGCAADFCQAYRSG